jgi:hypothetical protein
MRARWSFVVLLTVLVLAACPPALASSSRDPTPVLGVPGHGNLPPDALGWGTARPGEISNGGDESSIVSGIT